MSEPSKRPVASVTINYEDGTHENLYHYAVVGLGEEARYSIMFPHLKTSDKLNINNLLADLSRGLLNSINLLKRIR